MKCNVKGDIPPDRLLGKYLPKKVKSIYERKNGYSLALNS